MDKNNKAQTDLGKHKLPEKDAVKSLFLGRSNHIKILQN